MTIKNRGEYILYRFRRADESIEEATLLAQSERWNGAVNRLYYACFYAAIAGLLKNQIQAKTHEGVRTQFGLHFVKSGKIDKRFGQLYSKLFDYRQKGDYGDLYDFDKETVLPLISRVKEFIDEVRKFID